MRDLPPALTTLGGTAILALALLALVPPAAQAKRGCVGAAAMDRERPCLNRTRAVRPAPDKVTRVSLPYCHLLRRERDPQVCTFGARAARARAHVALIGDSHALHWRAALHAVARRERWRGFSLTAPACFFSAAVGNLPAGLREACVPWYRSARAWFRRHPEVSTVFVSQKADTPVVAPRGRTASAVRIAGFRRAWRSLPRSVKRVVVIRDVPDPADDMFECVERVVAAGQEPPGPACATPRSAALRWDYAVSAAARSTRFRHVDLTPFFCDEQRCFPVVGGVRVYNDVLGHITVAYARTLAPYLRREIRRVLR